MGIYLNPGNEKFYQAVHSEIYVDKTEMIAYSNQIMRTNQKYICVSRPRRFGKSMAVSMLAAYYSRGCDSKELFQNLLISKSDSFLEHLNRYDVIMINMQEFLSKSDSMKKMLERLQKFVLKEIKQEYPDVDYFDEEDLSQNMQDVYYKTKHPFVVIIDEWDCIFREYKGQKEDQNKYLDFLRDLLKDREYIYLAYMTGILPIKKYGTHSALNMFNEFSMTNPDILARFVGFTEQEVEKLCQEYGRNPEELKEWYDGYHFKKEHSVYSPRSVVRSVTSGIFDTYWNQTENFEALKLYIDMNFDGLKDDVLSMMSGEKVRINTGSFSNDMVTFHTKDDVLTLLIHLGYVGYDFDNESVFIPNNEIRREFYNAVSTSDWGEVSNTLLHSSATLEAIWAGKSERVAQEIEQAHFETSHIRYHDENALSYTISLALYTARNFYTVYRELPTGKGFADMVYLPRKKFPEKPALVVELKWDKSADGAIGQIKKKQYCKSLEEYQGNILLVGINYDKDTRKHECVIEEYRK